MNILFVGFGSIAQKHFKVLLELMPKSNFFALKSSPRPTNDFRIKDIFEWNSLPSAIDFAIISNPTYKHTETIIELVKRNIPLFIEKPISHQLESLDKLDKEIRLKNLPTYIACNLRFLPALIHLKEKVLPTVNKINEVSTYCGSYLPDWRPGQDYQKIYSTQESMGGGVHLDLFHELDYNYWLFGLPEKSCGTLRSKSSLEISAPDFASYQLQYRDFTSLVTLNYYRRTPKRELEIVTDKDIFTVNLLKNCITDGSGNIIFANPEYGIANTYKGQMLYFLDMLQGKKAPINTFSESLQILKICLHAKAI